MYVVSALNGGTPRLKGLGGWTIVEIISQGDNPSGDWSMPRDFDGLGAWKIRNDTLRIYVNHETTGDSTISEVNLDLSELKRVVARKGATAGAKFVRSARQAFQRVQLGGGRQKSTSQKGDVWFDKFCSGQSYQPHAFGYRRGFVDPLYIAGEEEDGGRLVVLDSIERELYVLSGKIGHANWTTGNGGMPFDSWENAALLDTGEVRHVALLLSSDGGSDSLQLYIGLKGMTHNCVPSTEKQTFLERNGLSCGRWYYLTGKLPDSVGIPRPGGFSSRRSKRLQSTKLEDIDASPSDPTKVALTDENDGVFIFDFDLHFGNNPHSRFEHSNSSFTVTKIARACRSCGSNKARWPDNVEWTDATDLGGMRYPSGLLFINEDSDSGEVLQMLPNGTHSKRIARVTN